MRTTLPLLLALATTPALAATQVSLRPDVVPPGGVATLSITTDTGAQPALGDIPGATVTGTGRTSQVQVINGSVSQSTVWTYQIVPSAPGEIQLGPFQVGSDTTRSVSLSVDPSAPAPQRSRLSASPLSWGLSSPRTRQAPAPAAIDQGERAFARMWVGDGTPVVGQATPMTVSVYLRGDVGGVVEGGPQIEARDFVIDGLDDQPTRKETEVDGVPYTQFTWTASLTPVREGSYSLDATVPATLQWLDASADSGRSLFDEMIADDPFFQGSGIQSMLQGMGHLGGLEPQVRSTHVDLSARRSLEVVAPPLAGRPEAFDGLVGTLQANLGEVPATARVGEPFELTWSLTGTGNLDSHHSQGLTSGEGYDAYPPEREFDPSVRSRTKGTLSYKQLVVPRQGGVLDLPPLELAWFDPQADAYQTATLPFPPIEVQGGPVAATVPSPAHQAITEPGPAVAPDPGDERHAQLLPSTARREILVLVPLLWLLVGVSWLTRGRTRALAEALRERLSTRWKAHRLRTRLRVALHHEDPEEVLRAGLALVEAEAPDADTDEVRAFVDCADLALYAHVTPDHDTLESLATHLLEALDHEEAA